MTRLVATATAHSPLLAGMSEAFRSLFAGRTGAMTGVEALEREHDRIRLTSRHWLMG